MALDQWVQDVIFTRAEARCCDPSQPCENCGHPMSGHWAETADFYAVACRVCPCQRWCCRHGGHRI
jgi:hypothetical protein